MDLLGQFGFVCKKFASLTKDENLWKGILNNAFTYIDHPSVRDSIALKGKYSEQVEWLQATPVNGLQIVLEIDQARPLNFRGKVPITMIVKNVSESDIRVPLGSYGMSRFERGSLVTLYSELNMNTNETPLNDEFADANT